MKVVGVEPEGAPTLYDALAAGRPVDAPTGSVAADSLAPRQVGALMFPIAQRYIPGVTLVSDDEIRAAQAALWKTLRIVAEPGGATAFAALLSGKYRPAPASASESSSAAATPTPWTSATNPTTARCISDGRR